MCVAYTQEPNPFDSGLVLINCDKEACKTMTYLDVNTNVVFYIEHLEAGTGSK